MDATQPQFLDVGSGAQGRRIAYLRQESKDKAKPSLIFLSGFNSNMRGIKAESVAQWAAVQGIGCLRFDYSGHGESTGRLEDGTLSRWLEEARCVFERLSEGPQILIGSSMVGNISLLLIRWLMS
jgi:pimeloyl-ACP methyl ester carboxylesterase